MAISDRQFSFGPKKFNNHLFRKFPVCGPLLYTTVVVSIESDVTGSQLLADVKISIHLEKLNVYKKITPTTKVTFSRFQLRNVFVSNEIPLKSSFVKQNSETLFYLFFDIQTFSIVPSRKKSNLILGTIKNGFQQLNSTKVNLT